MNYFGMIYLGILCTHQSVLNRHYLHQLRYNWYVDSLFPVSVVNDKYGNLFNIVMATSMALQG
jgi:hypothetical protein